MSYILDALKKSQEERAAINQELPAVFSEGNDKASASGLGVVVLILVLVLAILGLVYYLSVQSFSQVESDILYLETEPQLVPKPVMTEQVIEPREVVTLDERVDKYTPQTITEPIISKGVVEERKLPPLTSLRKIPVLVINSHIYSGLASKRSVTINNKSQREGDYLTSEILLKEITPKGIVIEVDGWPLSISRQQGWQPIP